MVIGGVGPVGLGSELAKPANLSLAAFPRPMPRWMTYVYIILRYEPSATSFRKSVMIQARRVKGGSLADVVSTQDFRTPAVPGAVDLGCLRNIGEQRRQKLLLWIFWISGTSMQALPRS